MKTVCILGAFVLLVPVSILLHQVIGPLFLWYRLSDDAVRVIFLGIPIIRVPIDSIIEARPMTFAQAAAFNLKHPYTTLAFGNKVIVPAVLIHRKARWLRWLLITPDDGDTFVRTIMERVSRRPGSSGASLPSSEP